MNDTLQKLIWLSVATFVAMQFGVMYAMVVYIVFMKVQATQPMVSDWKKVEHFEGSVDELEKILTGKGDSLVVVDFYATWCPPCRALAPKLADLSEAHPTVTFIGINADTSSSVARHYAVTAYPTIIFIKDSDVIHQIRGADYNQIVKTINSEK
eukprot:TRINITY_DN27030_c0_g1_i1.p1 TRINITY_DN27030_c0_g1~~TRINITY_DN27030_c0_g1_i1.p1  ORF type:complete len:154 (+),score=41.57 TRINITY_DN27030_c0_g1_i1:84-545(+)